MAPPANRRILISRADGGRRGPQPREVAADGAPAPEAWKVGRVSLKNHEENLELLDCDTFAFRKQ